MSKKSKKLREAQERAERFSAKRAKKQKYATLGAQGSPKPKGPNSPLVGYVEGGVAVAKPLPLTVEAPPKPDYASPARPETQDHQTPYHNGFTTSRRDETSLARVAPGIELIVHDCFFGRTVVVGRNIVPYVTGFTQRDVHYLDDGTEYIKFVNPKRESGIMQRTRIPVNDSRVEMYDELYFDEGVHLTWLGMGGDVEEKTKAFLFKKVGETRKGTTANLLPKAEAPNKGYASSMNPTVELPHNVRALSEPYPPRPTERITGQQKVILTTPTSAAYRRDEQRSTGRYGGAGERSAITKEVRPTQIREPVRETPKQKSIELIVVDEEDLHVLVVGPSAKEYVRGKPKDEYLGEGTLKNGMPFSLVRVNDTSLAPWQVDPSVRVETYEDFNLETGGLSLRYVLHDVEAQRRKRTEKVITDILK
ncbi:hypothetical protein COV17_01965 [Candidatus Woesearchaeota archaeon CG10_big_fil_rev_8_21_14_0_10_36_11]|nr:MAG: hypothetical protein COV17_01965 [Candidatus Woesearchaeota archaeon CG10_big_fil_rev_8_21_14_0_10_36_11]